MKNIWCIYKHTLKEGFIHSGWSYIGLTKYSNNPNTRWRNGKGYLNKRHKLFAAAIKKYGWDAFNHEIIEKDITTIEEANIREKYWIAFYHTYIKDPLCKGYNATIGGDGTVGRVMSETEKQYRRNLKLGTKASSETKLKMSQTRRGKKQNMTNKKIIALKKMQQNNIGKHQKPETILQISKTAGSKNKKETILNYKAKHAGKAIHCIELNLDFNTIIEAAMQLGICKSGIVSCLKGRRSIAGGYHWIYIKKIKI